MVSMSSWGRLTHAPHEVCSLINQQQIHSLLTTKKPGIAYGMGRSYGDVCLNPNGILWKTTQLDRFIHFDEVTGRLRCEAGVLLGDIQQLLIPRGWMLPVTPGTQMVTVGGAIANDVHGKNHHLFGSFGHHVQRIRLLRTDGTIIDCSADSYPEWFFATIGGLGLTGIISEVDLQLRPTSGPWLDTETIPFASLDEFFLLANASTTQWEHTVSWIDCLAQTNCRGIFMRANPSPVINLQKPKQRVLVLPFQPPFSLINRVSLKLFNSAYFKLNKRKAGKQLMHYQPFFYPLDKIAQWNKIYGPKGFYQYQSVVPQAVGRDAVHAMLHEIAGSGEGSFLAVLKTFGPQASLGMLSFPQHGVTLALDFPNRGAKTEQLFKRLDSIVGEAGGRIYPAKDARMPRALFAAGYPRLSEFQTYRDPGISSSLSRRLMGT